MALSYSTYLKFLAADRQLTCNTFTAKLSLHGSHHAIELISINLMFIKKYFNKGRHHTFNKTVLHKYPLKSSSKISYLEEKQQKYNGSENHAPTRILVKSMLVPVHFRITQRSALSKRVAPPYI